MDHAWPLSDLRLRTGGLELRLPDEADLFSLAALTSDPIHDQDVMWFAVPWTDASPVERARSTLQWHWRQRAEWRPDAWTLELVAVRDGEIVGTQSVTASSFAVRREVATGSWVGRRFQGQGVGRAMRRAVLHLAFVGLGALTARSAAFDDNVASIRVSERLGYAEDGTESVLRRGGRATEVRLLLTRAAWEERSAGWPPVEMSGLEGSLSMFGVG